MRLTTINEKALIDTALLLVGEQATNAILAVYQLVDSAQREAYDLGVNVGMSNVDDIADQAWDAGYDAGEEDGLADIEKANDDGYIAGVRDARARPAEADANVAEIMAYEAEQAYDEANFQDSGDVANIYRLMKGDIG